MTSGLRLGAPGVYTSPSRVEPAAGLVRLDVAGFVGVAPRGPGHRPVAVTSWSDYQRWFGGFEGRGRLPYAVQAFFAQGGVRAQVLRAVPPTGGDGATARHRLVFGAGLAVELAAANEGSWGNDLSVTVRFDAVQRFHGTVRADRVTLPAGASVPLGSLLLVGDALRWVVALTDAGAVLDRPLTITGERDLAVVTATVRISDGDLGFARQETWPGLGLHPLHPRFAANQLREGSALVTPAAPWTDPLAPLDSTLLPIDSTRSHEGVDRWAEIDRRSFFDAEPADADPLDEADHLGVDVLGRNGEIGLLCVPDLYWTWDGRGPVVDPPPARTGGGCFRPCAPDPVAVQYRRRELEPVLDGRDPADLAEIVARQHRLLAVAELRRRFVVLLDAPAGLPAGEVVAWRSRFDSSYAAAYFPWLGVPVPEQPLVLVPPSAFAAGVIAAREIRLGLPWGPANELAAGAVLASDLVSDAEHDRLHLSSVNVFRAERDGFRLSAARTLSSNPDYRQLSVRRLMTVLALSIDQQAQRLVFEPGTPGLRDRVRQLLVQLLRGLNRQGAFAGDTEEQSFFVHCDEGLNPPSSQALGRVVAEVGVAPAAPLEYLVLRVAQDADGVSQVEVGNAGS
ncbi:phage tail sheath family protein [Kutzneria albida]|uniref:Tail sheath protein C-terminal domain-containing protein n=1 Tax=Kutzneria albida DSM 43870 TaxID=1449976 RepID=W5WF51_9PSEU|nr:phage tail sheath C-terminal domain-containing protein [Kutzneria albida]AHH99477.1 hypothetical protein KALB_6117 [Kutzneria albida DSM 43870]